MKIAVTTSSFATYGSEPLDLLARAGVDIVTNPHGRKLRPEETVALLAGCAGVVAGRKTWAPPCSSACRSCGPSRVAAWAWTTWTCPGARPTAWPC